CPVRLAAETAVRVSEPWRPRCRAPSAPPRSTHDSRISLASSLSSFHFINVPAAERARKSPTSREPEKQLDYRIVGASLYHRFGSPRNTSVAKGSDRSYSRMSHQQPCSGTFTSLLLDSLI